MSILDNAKQIADAVHEIQNLELYKRVLGTTPGTDGTFPIVPE